MRWHWQASCVVCAVVVVLLFVSLSAGDMSLDEEKDQGSLIFFASLLKPTQYRSPYLGGPCRAIFYPEDFCFKGSLLNATLICLFGGGCRSIQP